tara:strand:+ start:310 stop:537 length:228 start_codon:yes stop_codon:yes gene_type:complete
MRKEVKYSLLMVTVLFLAMAGFINYLENNVYPEVIQLSPGAETSNFNIIYVVLGIFWALAALFIIIKNRKEHEEV